jgi:hypothetical protein
MKGLSWCWVLCLFLFACSNEKAGTSAKLTSFKGMPPGVEGCSCYFAANEKDFKNERYLFVSDMDSSAWISVNKKQVELRLVSSTKDQSDSNAYQETYSNGLYTLVINVTVEENTGDEVWWNTGKLQLFFKETEIDSRTFSGECGC